MPLSDKECFTPALTQRREFVSSFAENPAHKSIHFFEENRSNEVMYRRNILVGPEHVPAWLVDFVVSANGAGTRGAARARRARYFTHRNRKILRASR
jgi:hypothetical protein